MGKERETGWRGMAGLRVQDSGYFEIVIVQVCERMKIVVYLQPISELAYSVFYEKSSQFGSYYPIG